MTSSTSSSSSALVLHLVLALAVGAAGCAGARPGRGERAPFQRVAVFPPENLAGAGDPGRPLLRIIEDALARAGLEAVSGDAVDQFLAAHRIRYTGGVNGEVALAARQDLDVDAIVVTSIEVWSPEVPPKVAITMRLVSTTSEPEVLWIDGASQAGDDTQGLLGLGAIDHLDVLARDAIGKLARSLRAYVRGGGARATRCPVGGSFKPKLSYRSPLFQLGRATVGVLPFVNETRRAEVGEVVALHHVRQLVAVDGIRVLDPGVIRDHMLQYRLIMPGGISLAQASTMLKSLDIDLVVSGYVRRYDEPIGSTASPRVDFTTLVLDRNRDEIVWESTSYARGRDDVVFFATGNVSTAGAMTCRMVSAAVSGLVGPAGRIRSLGEVPGAATTGAAMQSPRVRAP